MDNNAQETIMTAEEYLRQHKVDLTRPCAFSTGIYIIDDDAYKAVDIAKRQIAQSIIDRYKDNTLKTVEDIINYCHGIVDF